MSKGLVKPEPWSAPILLGAFFKDSEVMNFANKHGVRQTKASNHDKNQRQKIRSKQNVREARLGCSVFSSEMSCRVLQAADIIRDTAADIMEDLTDAELRQQLVAHGEKSIGPITDTTRAIYRKKLNHLKAAGRKASKERNKSQSGRRLTALSSDDSENEVPVAPSKTRRSRSTRGKAKTAAKEPPTPAPAAPGPSRSSPPRVAPSPRRSLRNRKSVVAEPKNEEESSEEEEAKETAVPPSRSRSSILNRSRNYTPRSTPPTMSSAALQVSMNNTLSLSRYENQNDDGPGIIEISDSDPDMVDYGLPSTRSKSSRSGFKPDGPSSPSDTRKAVSPASSDDSFLNRTWARWMGNGGGNVSRSEETRKTNFPRTSTPTSGHLLRQRVVPSTQNDDDDDETRKRNFPRTSTPTSGHLLRRRGTQNDDDVRSKPNATFAFNHVGGNSHHLKTTASTSQDQSGLLSEDDMEREFKTEEDPSNYSHALYISKVLVIVVALFFLCLALAYLTMSGPSLDTASKSAL